ncbi:hypothetical protein VNO77_33921 [Canavalia gladiata]|uniref:Uncharacterized protein n=1 Tax=Canavalia gladiata TaxID=3824 RepID=A0AAN9KDC0_CANGL
MRRDPPDWSTVQATTFNSSLKCCRDQAYRHHPIQKLMSGIMMPCYFETFLLVATDQQHDTGSVETLLQPATHSVSGSLEIN